MGPRKLAQAGGEQRGYLMEGYKEIVKCKHKQERVGPKTKKVGKSVWILREHTPPRPHTTVDKSLWSVGSCYANVDTLTWVKNKY